MIVIAIVVAGFALILWSSMLNRGMATSWEGDRIHDWEPSAERSFGTRLVGFAAGPPAFIVLTVAAAYLLGWWTPVAMIAGIPVSFVMNLMLLGGSRSRVADRMRFARLPVSLAAIACAVLAVQMV